MAEIEYINSHENCRSLFFLKFKSKPKLMPCILALVALAFPRVLIVILWLLTDWFDGVFNSVLWPVLGFFFMPVTMLWYSVVVNHYGGQWSTLNIILMVLAVVIDIGSWGGGYKSRNRD